MGDVTRMTPKTGQRSEGMIKEFLEQWGGKLDGVLIIARHKDGSVIDGWSVEVGKDLIFWLGALEQTKLDFWDIYFLKRSDLYEE